MASNDSRRLNPGIKVSNLFPGTGTKVNQFLELQTSAVLGLLVGSPSVTMAVSGSNPHFGFALNSSGALLPLTP
jgi:hypothetical protein